MALNGICSVLDGIEKYSTLPLANDLVIRTIRLSIKSDIRNHNRLLYIIIILSLSLSRPNFFYPEVKEFHDIYFIIYVSLTMYFH